MSAYKDEDENECQGLYAGMKVGWSVKLYVYGWV